MTQAIKEVCISFTSSLAKCQRMMKLLEDTAKNFQNNASRDMTPYEVKEIIDRNQYGLVTYGINRIGVSPKS